MNDFKQSVMIALLPMTTDWCKIDLPHLTLVYCGEIKDLKATAFNEIAKDAASIAMLSRPLQLRVTGVDVLGDEDKVDVLKILPNAKLFAMRRFVERWNRSEYPFNPHCTIGPTGSFVPPMPPALAFDRVMVGWGEESLTFWLDK